MASANLKRTALPGSELGRHLDWHAKTFKSVKKKPVISPGKEKPNLGVLKPRVQ